MPLQEIEEISVPTYGLQEVGVRRAQLGEFGVELVVTRYEQRRSCVGSSRTAKGRNPCPRPSKSTAPRS